MYELTIPVPGNEKDLLWFVLGLQFGRSFGKKLDHDIQQSEWFKSQPPWMQGITKRILDFTHHWWVGYILWCYASAIAVWIRQPGLTNEIFWFGIGLLVDDLPDLYLRLREGYQNIRDYMKE